MILLNKIPQPLKLSSGPKMKLINQIVDGITSLGQVKVVRVEVRVAKVVMVHQIDLHRSRAIVPTEGEEIEEVEA
jgi:hypothetical protein